MSPEGGRAPDLSAASFAYVPSAADTAARLGFARQEWRQLAGYYGVIACLHLLGWGLFLHYSAAYPSLLGLGLAAYMFGLRHAFDADHIAAVDDSVRYLLQRGQRPLGIGFFFSLGHSSVVFALSLAVIVAGAWLKQEMPALRQVGGLIGTGISGAFLWFIGALNVVVLLDILKVWRQARGGSHSHDHIEQLLRQRGLMNRLFGGWLQRALKASWQMYPLGLLFGLGFDTASEVGLLGMTAGASAGNLPVPAALSLPLLFAAGMSLMDTTDGVLMVKAYNWAFVNPLRKIFYNLATTSLSIAVAFLIGSVELLQVLIRLLELKGAPFDTVAALDFGRLGYGIVALFLLAWGGSVAVWKLARLDRRYGSPAAHRHWHDHDGAGHTHQHFH